MAQTGTKAFTPEQIKRGAALYATNCESCHGVRMIGPPWASEALWAYVVAGEK
jgi:mono/diheme cytochrome c family protein